MNVNEILRREAQPRVGYLPQTVSKTTFTPDGILTKMRRIPHKISAYFDTSKIREVFKSSHARHDIDNYYILRATDGTLFHIEF